VTFDLSTNTNKSAMKAFRFDLAGVVELYTKFRLPKVVITKQGYRATGLDALCLVLRSCVPDAPDRHDVGLSTLRGGHFLDLSPHDCPARMTSSAA
jgi:hypothetical protein